MRKTNAKGFVKVLSAIVCIALAGGSAFAKKAAADAVKEEDGVYYGYGKAKTKEEAVFLAQKSLIEDALSANAKALNPKAGRVSVSDDSAKARIAAGLKTSVAGTDKAQLDVSYRIKAADWDKTEQKFQDALRAKLAPRYESLSSKKIADKINESVVLMTELAANGVADILTAQPAGTEILSKRIEAICADAVKELVLQISVKDGFIDSKTVFTVSAKDGAGNAVSGLNLRTVWSIPSLPVNVTVPENSEVLGTVKTDISGNAVIAYPVEELFRNIPVTLTVSTAFSVSSQATTAMKKLDAASSIDGNFVHFDDVQAAFAGVKVEAGEFNAGAVPSDSRAGKSEASRTVTTAAYEIMITPVTNAAYAAYVHATRGTEPEFFINDDYNKGAQPVIGISLADAEAYAAWLSEQTGSVYRLPTEEEWEKAARAGKEIIYPWGDEDPKKAKCANFKKNGKFNGTSPVGAFENGKNEWGLVDMSGNVWEWTTSAHNEEGETNLRTVKGGSWMDGPADLRISNYSNRNSENGYPDVGFRLVKEVSE